MGSSSGCHGRLSFAVCGLVVRMEIGMTEGQVTFSFILERYSSKEWSASSALFAVDKLFQPRYRALEAVIPHLTERGGELVEQIANAFADFILLRELSYYRLFLRGHPKISYHITSLGRILSMNLKLIVGVWRYGPGGDRYYESSVLLANALFSNAPVVTPIAKPDVTKLVRKVPSRAAGSIAIRLRRMLARLMVRVSDGFWCGSGTVNCQSH